jgi:predicted RNase H-like HicB family nuclease
VAVKRVAIVRCFVSEQIRCWRSALVPFPLSLSSFYGAPMKRNFDVVIERDRAGYYVASVPLLPGCRTQALSLDELMARLREAIELCLEVEEGDGEPLDFIGIQRITIAA